MEGKVLNLTIQAQENPRVVRSVARKVPQGHVEDSLC